MSNGVVPINIDKLYFLLSGRGGTKIREIERLSQCSRVKVMYIIIILLLALYGG